MLAWSTYTIFVRIVYRCQFVQTRSEANRMLVCSVCLCMGWTIVWPEDILNEQLLLNLQVVTVLHILRRFIERIHTLRQVDFWLFNMMISFRNYNQRASTCIHFQFQMLPNQSTDVLIWSIIMMNVQGKNDGNLTIFPGNC